MYFDSTRYDIIDLELPNIKFAAMKDDTSVRSIATHPFLLELITKVAKAKPKWTLIADVRSYRSVEPEWATRFYVFENGEELGIIRKGYSYSKNCDEFEINNDRMTKQRVRGDSTRTKDMSRAYKVITKEFHARTTTEILAEATSKVTDFIRTQTNVANNKYVGMHGTVFAQAKNFAEENWDKFMPYILAAGVQPDAITKYHEAKVDMENTRTVSTPLSNSAGYTVYIRETDYLINSSEGARSYTQAELPDYFRRAIGMLQLVEGKQLVPNIGARVSDKIMYILPEEKEDEDEDED